MASASSGSSKSSTSPDPIRPSAEDEAGVSNSNNVAAEVNSGIQYKIGQTLLDDSHSIPFRSSSEAAALLSKLPLNSPLFVRRTSGEWTLALLAGKRMNRRGGVSLVVDFRDGDERKKKVLRKNRWRGSLRLANREVVSWDPPPAVGPDAGGRPAAAEHPRRREAERPLRERGASERREGVDPAPDAARARAPEAAPPREVPTETADGRPAKTAGALERENEEVDEGRDLPGSRLNASEWARVSLEVMLATEHARKVFDAVDSRRRARAGGPPSDEATEGIVGVGSEERCLRDCLDIVTGDVKNLQGALEAALESQRAAETDRDRANAEAKHMKAVVECNERVVKSLLDEKDHTIGRLEAELRTTKGELLSFEAKAEDENEGRVLKWIAERDYFDDDALLGESSATLHSVDEDAFLGASSATLHSASDRSLSRARGNSGRSWRWSGWRGRGTDDDDDHSTLSDRSSLTWTTTGRR